jgi:hypothetical protein
MHARDLVRESVCGREKTARVICFAGLSWNLAKTQPLSFS